MSKELRGWDSIRKRVAQAESSVQGRQRLAVKRAAALAEREIKLGIVKQAPGGKRFKRLSPLTIALSGRSKALAKSGGTGLAGSIKTTFDEKKNQAFVGVHRGAKTSGGKDLVNVALIHEFGTKPFAIKVTDSMRKFFWWAHFKTGGRIQPLKSTTTVINHPGVPARPFIRPTIEAIRPQIQAILREAFVTKNGPF